MTNTVIKDSPNKGKGLFILENIPANHTIFKFVGIPILRMHIEDFSGPVAACYLQIGSDLYLNLEGHPSFFVNHSCNPNCCVKIMANQAFLASIRPIQTGEELLFDYSTTSTEDKSTWSMKCSCSLFKCRKLITGFNSLSDAEKEKYKKIGAIPNYLA